MSCREGRERIRFHEALGDLEMVFLIVRYRMFWGQIGVKRCQNWSQKRVKKVSEILSDGMVSLGSRMSLMVSVFSVLLEIVR